MPEKHYNIHYLEGTALVLKNIKENSYKPFAGIEEGFILDLGCGPGIDAINIAKILGQQVKVTGIDHDPVMIDKAKASAQVVPNVDFILSEAYPVPFDDQSVDGARAERLLQHLKEPAALVAEAYRVLRPGSPFVIVETDWSSLSFYNADISTAKKVNDYLTGRKVNNGAVARETSNLLKGSHFKNISLEVYPFVVRSFQEIFTYLLIDQSLTEMKDKGYMTEDEHAAFIKDLEEAEASGYFVCTINLIIASAVK